MSLRKEVTSAIAWSLGDKFLKRGVRFVLSIFLARLLTPSDFGVVAMASIFVSWAEVFRDFGMGQAIIQDKDVTDTQTSTVFYINLFMGVLIALIFVLIAPWASRFYDNKMVAWVVRVAGLTFIITSLNVVQFSLFVKALNYKVGTIASFLASTVSGILGIAMAFMGFGVWSLLAQSVMSSVITTGYVWFKSKWRPKRLFNFKETRPLFIKGVGFMGQGLVDNVFNSLGSMVIGKAFSPAMLGLFSRGHDLATMPETTLIAPITRPLFPIFAKIKDKEELRRYYIRTLEMLNWAMIFVCGLLLLCSDEIILIMYGIQWVESAPFLFLLSLLIPFVPYWTTTTALWKAIGHVKEVALLTFVDKFLAFLSIIALFHSIKLYAIMLIVSFFLANVIKTRINIRIMKMSLWEQYREWFMDMAIMVVAVLLISRLVIDSTVLSFVLKSVSFILVYWALSSLLKIKGMHTLVYLAKDSIITFRKK